MSQHIQSVLLTEGLQELSWVNGYLFPSATDAVSFFLSARLGADTGALLRHVPLGGYDHFKGARYVVVGHAYLSPGVPSNSYDGGDATLFSGHAGYVIYGRQVSTEIRHVVTPSGILHLPMTSNILWARPITDWFTVVGHTPEGDQIRRFTSTTVVH